MTTPKALLKALDARDGRVCAWHGVSCGEDTLVPQHRGNRGMGGRKSGHQIANLLWLCSAINTDVETTAVTAALARRSGIKISSHEDPTKVAVDHAVHGRVYLHDDGTYSRAEKEVA